MQPDPTSIKKPSLICEISDSWLALCRRPRIQEAGFKDFFCILNDVNKVNQVKCSLVVPENHLLI